MGALWDENLGVGFALASMVFLKTIAMMAPTGSSVNHYAPTPRSNRWIASVEQTL
jgi:hypothetical protein